MGFDDDPRGELLDHGSSLNHSDTRRSTSSLTSSTSSHVGTKIIRKELVYYFQKSSSTIILHQREYNHVDVKYYYENKIFTCRLHI